MHGSQQSQRIHGLESSTHCSVLLTQELHRPTLSSHCLFIVTSWLPKVALNRHTTKVTPRKANLKHKPSDSILSLAVNQFNSTNAAAESVNLRNTARPNAIVMEMTGAEFNSRTKGFRRRKRFLNFVQIPFSKSE